MDPSLPDFEISIDIILKFSIILDFWSEFCQISKSLGFSPLLQLFHTLRLQLFKFVLVMASKLSQISNNPRYLQDLVVFFLLLPLFSWRPGPIEFLSSAARKKNLLHYCEIHWVEKYGTVNTGFHWAQWRISRKQWLGRKQMLSFIGQQGMSEKRCLLLQSFGCWCLWRVFLEFTQVIILRLEF